VVDQIVANKNAARPAAHTMKYVLSIWTLIFSIADIKMIYDEVIQLMMQNR